MKVSRSSAKIETNESPGHRKRLGCSSEMIDPMDPKEILCDTSSYASDICPEESAITSLEIGKLTSP